MRVHLEKVLVSSPERTFDAFVDGEQLRQWWGPAGFTVASLQLDVAEGANYRITMQPGRGDAFDIRGTFRVIEAPRRLVKTEPRWELHRVGWTETLERLETFLT